MSGPALVACAAAAMALGLPAIAGAGALEVRHRVAAAADSAALAAADAVGGWIDAEPCTIAEEVAAAASATISSCDVDLESGVAGVVVRAPTLLGAVEIAARAGPPGIE